jgi:hypothetical protein
MGRNPTACEAIKIEASKKVTLPAGQATQGSPMIRASVTALARSLPCSWRRRSLRLAGNSPLKSMGVPADKAIFPGAASYIL